MSKSKCLKLLKSVILTFRELKILKPELSIIENVMENSIYKEDFARLLLARLLFRGESVCKSQGTKWRRASQGVICEILLGYYQHAHFG